MEQSDLHSRKRQYASIHHIHPVRLGLLRAYYAALFQVPMADQHHDHRVGRFMGLVCDHKRILGDLRRGLFLGRGPFQHLGAWLHDKPSSFAR